MSSQGHTGANHQNKVDDSRNNELFVTINEIDRLRPDIFILENVPGMKRDREKENENEEARNFAVEGIKGLRNIGYQVRVVQLDSRSFGSPQNRTRLFLICARKGIPLPSIPEPTHVNPELKKNIFDIDHKASRDFYVGSQGDYGSGPLPAVTVRDALSDLPRFEYIYGHNRSTGQMRRFNPRKEVGTHVGFLTPAPYACPAQNDFQAKQRNPAGEVENHCTPTWTPRILDL
jgi:site-specific DNA-cytosine methylase